jgi:cell division protein FtsZ
LIRETAHPDVNLIFGAVIDEKMGDSIRITVIATGFDHAGTTPVRRRVQTPAQQPVAVGVTSRSTAAAQPAETAQPAAGQGGLFDFPVRQFDQDNLEVPAFLRRRRS